jgi:hypothetical protein
MTLARILQVSVLLTLALGVAADDRAATGKAEFVGGSPCDSLPREFLGGIRNGAPCMWIGWRLTLSSDPATGRPTGYDLVAVYGVPTRGNPNVSEDGPRVERHGAWEIERGTAADPDAVVFRLRGSEPGRSLAFVRVGERLLHLLGSQKRLLAGNGGWSYTLNLAGSDTLAARAPEAPLNVAAPARTTAPLSGVFDGRTPCQPLARQLGVAVSGECFKMKWRLRLHEAPRTYVLEGSPYRAAPRTGRWAVLPAPSGSKGFLYQLDPDSPRRSLAFLRADDDVLLFLDEKGELLVGNADFSHTLNRVRLPR